MPRFSQIQPILLAILFTAASAAALGWLWITVDSLGTQLTDRIQTIANEQAFDAQYNELSTMVEETKEERARLQRYILSGEDDTIQLLSRLDAVALDHGVELGTSELNVRDTNDPFDTLDLRFQMSGNEARVMHMIEVFETLPYHGRVTALSVSRQTDEETGARTVDASISLALTIEDYDQ